MKTNLPEETKYTVGIDVSKEKLDVYDEKNGSRSLPNTPAKIGALLKSLEQEREDESGPYVIREPSGGYEKTDVEAALKAGIDISVVNARQVRDFAKAKGKLAKTDEIDARVFFYPLSEQPMFDHAQTPIAHSICNRAINLPSYHDLKDAQIDRVCQVILDLMPKV